MHWPKNLNKAIKTEINLAGYTNFRIGGRAKYFFEPKNLKELQQALVSAKRADLRVFILGAGSNILVSDTGLTGLVIRLSHKDFRKCRCQGSCLVAGGGLKLNALISFSREKNLSGLEFLAGIPGTLGGSLMGNAGAWGKAIGELVSRVGVLDYNGKLKLLGSKQLKFAYRKSNLNNYIIIWAKLKLLAGKKKVMAAKIKEYLLRRKQTQGDHLPNAGCIFKNPTCGSAGRLIDSCGLKGKAKGGTVISKLHANFILNTGKAKSGDVLSLMDLMQRKVRERFKINLEPEIKIWK
ncbi:MAG: UDP-N-acetylmuramate dehydrogenase [Candidatus Omnitrophica bacterium]|nr:UDP-N-acetylmuramate dehydrogenase [Candidatus Omnitrophota bacterium]MBU4302904.1 UDP-N-acetylmuramate dehydrogenase [Candidatus Omnitrophota bacterium]MBU4468152.1 UDP-N-acetylmuramate dehydrogenase [Candidatus Omnitrophota bacterium]MCG2707614.1 UDP-N-acetylmuramate dehydrogenase [Candidatus Omnitrophota bacterium]